MEKIYLRKNINSYQFIFVLFLLWIFVIYFFHKDPILENLSHNKDIFNSNNNSRNINVKNNNFIEEDDEFQYY